jgi:hypothetical protein
VRYLRARKGDVKAASKLLHSTLAWWASLRDNMLAVAALHSPAMGGGIKQSPRSTLSAGVLRSVYLTGVHIEVLLLLVLYV